MTAPTDRERFGDIETDLPAEQSVILMNCREFELAWQARLDRPATTPIDMDVARHAAVCAACHARLGQYARLELALGSWGPAPAPSPDLAATILVRLKRERSRPILRVAQATVAAWLGLTGIAAAVLAAAVGLWGSGGEEPPMGLRHDPPPFAQTTPAESRRPLAESVAEVTTATLELAEATSAPAARLGRLFLASAANSPQVPAIMGAAAQPEADPAGDVLKAVGQRVSSGVRPLGSQTRRAFGFLIAPAETGVGPRPAPSNRGA